MSNNTRGHRRPAVVKLHQNATHKDSAQLVRRSAAYFDVAGTSDSGTSSLLFWSLAYMQAVVVGVQAKNTEDAKRRDLGLFLRFFAELNGHLDAAQWLARDTRAFLDHLEALGRAPTTINRVLRTLAHFARWVHQQPTTPFATTGMPTAGVKELATDEPDARKICRRDVLRLFKAADRLVLIETRSNSRPRRNRAMLALLYFTGLRISELTGLMLDQWDGKRLHRVRRKGNVRSTVVYVHREARQYLADYLEHERSLDNHTSSFLLLPHGGRGRLNRRTASRALVRIADEASKHGDLIHLHPHRLRHTFGHELSRRGTPPTEIAAHLGHQSLKYVGRYVRSTQAEREAVLDALSTGSLDSAA